MVATTGSNEQQHARAAFAQEIVDPLSLIALNVALLEQALAGARPLLQNEREALVRIAARTLDAVRSVANASRILRALDG